MSANQFDDRVREPVWTHQRVEIARSIPPVLDPLATVSRFQRDETIYEMGSSVECWYRINSGAARRIVLRADGKRQIIDLLLPGDVFGFGTRGRHAFTAEAITSDTAVARYPTAQIERLVAGDPQVVPELREVVLEATARLNSLILILGRTTAEEKVGCFLLYLQDRVGDGVADRLALPLTRYDIADYLALSVETVSRALTELKRRGVIVLPAPRKVGIVRREALEDRGDSVETMMKVSPVRRPPTRPSAPAQPAHSVEIRVRSHAFGDVLGDMRQWLDRRRCNPCDFNCIRDQSGAVVIRVAFTGENEATAKAFEEQFIRIASVGAGQRVNCG